MTAPVRLTDAERKALDYAIPPGGPVIRERVHAAVERILADRLPEATTVTEWGVRCPSNLLPCRSEVEAHADAEDGRTHDTCGGAGVVRRQHVRYADHYGPWEEV